MEVEAEIVVLQNGLRVQIVLGLDDRRSETHRVFATEAVSAEWSRRKLEHMRPVMIDRSDFQKCAACDLAVLKASSLMTMEAGSRSAFRDRQARRSPSHADAALRLNGAGGFFLQSIQKRLALNAAHGSFPTTIAQVLDELDGMNRSHGGGQIESGESHPILHEPEYVDGHVAGALGRSQLFEHVQGDRAVGGQTHGASRSCQ